MRRKGSFANGYLRGLLVVLFVVALVLGPGIVSAMGTSTGGGWTIVPSPNVGLGGNILRDIAVSDHVAWAVGSAGDNALVEAWNGAAWTVTDLPDMSPGSALYGVDSFPSGEAWAVGSVGRHTLVLWWQDSSWQIVPSPNVQNVPNRLLGVSARSPSDVWAVGKAGSGILIEHWNGHVWSVVAHPALRNPSVLTSVVAVPSGPVWAVGAESHPGWFFENAMSLRWTGSRWIRIPVPLPKTEWPLGDQNSRLEHVTLAGSDIWTAGWYHPDPGSCCLRGIIRHWSDGAWERVNVPEPRQETEASILYGIGGSAPDRIWAVGMADHQTYAVLRSGPRWKVVDTPNAVPPAEGVDYLLAVDSQSSGDWAVGYTLRNGESKQTLIVQYQT
jgi:hypothetical protein